MKHIEQFGNVFALHTRHTSYLLRTAPSGHMEHLHYGARVACNAHTERAIAQKPAFAPGCSIAYAPEHPALCLDQLRGEIATQGKGDLGAPFVQLRFADGNTTTDFIFSHAEILTEKPLLHGLPSATGADAALRITLCEKENPTLTLSLVYGVFADTDVITKSAAIHNATQQPMTLHQLASSQLDFADANFTFHSFRGAWIDEMHRCDTPLQGGCAFAQGRGGTSGNHTNPFTMLSRTGTGEHTGEVYGCNLIYSGNHQTLAQTGAFGRLRYQVGILPEGFSMQLGTGDSFTAPEAVLTYSATGFDTLSQNLHRFTRAHIIRGAWQYKERPVLLNSWEACYMKFTQSKLLKLAKAGKACGVELFVLDDGWFGARSDDTKALGDWAVNRKKLPDGLAGFAAQINALGMDFGLWLEPEMLNVDSDLYRAHPDWALSSPNRAHSEGRNQRILDLCNPNVCAYLKETLCGILGSANIAYVKWDMNRVMSDVFSPSLPPERQGEVAHRYMLGLYDILQHVTTAFPDILFESCASGGNRADLAMLCYMPQLWASDNTDALCRAEIQTGYSYAYPLSALGCHVSASPNHQTLRETPLATRFNTALCGVLGYELDFTALSAGEKAEITAQIAQYKTLRPWLQFADYHRLAPAPSPYALAPEQHAWCAVSPDKRHAIAITIQRHARPDSTPERLFIDGLLPQGSYRITNTPSPVDIRPFGSLISHVSPVPLKAGGALHTLAAQFVHLPGEVEDCIATGSLLSSCGVALAMPFAGTGFDENTKYLPDFASRLYFATLLEGDEQQAAPMPTEAAQELPV